MSKKATVDIYINDEQAKARFDDIQNELKQIKNLKDKAFAAGDVKGFNQLNAEMKKLTREANNAQKKVIDVDRVLANIKTASIKELRDALRKANQELLTMSRTDAGFEQKRAQIMRLDAEIQNSVARTKVHGGVMSKLAYGFNKYFTMATALIATFTGVAFGASQWIKGLSGMDDALANVMKTTGLTRKEVRELYTEFGNLNTRTPRMELLALAEEAGRLGKKTKKEVMDFVEVGNMIKVALGDDLKGDAAEAIKEVGKLSNIYKIGEKYGTDFRDSMLMVGSAINEVSANSQAQAPFLIDMLKRLGGLADQADISAQNVIGIASALDQLGQTSEVSGTAVNKVIINMFKDTETYADIAKMSVQDFSKLLQTDANEALIRMLEGLNGNNEGLTLMAKKFDGMGLDGARAIQVLSALASNTSLVRQEQALANKALIEATSLTNEYNIKNNNMAGNLQKIGQAVRRYFINSEINKGLEGIVGKFAKWVEIPIERKLHNEGREVAQLVGQLTNANTSTSERVELLQKLKEISPAIVEGIEAETLNYDTLAKNVKKYNDELINRIVIAKLTSQEQAILMKAAELGAKAKERELDIYELIYDTNIDIASSQGTIEEKIKLTVDYLIAQGASLDQVNKKSAITVNSSGKVVDNRSKEQKLLDEIIVNQSMRNDLLQRQSDIENDVAPIQNRIGVLKELLGINEKIVNQSKDKKRPLIDDTEILSEEERMKRYEEFVKANQKRFDDAVDRAQARFSILKLLEEEMAASNRVRMPGEENVPDFNIDNLLKMKQLLIKQQYQDGLINADQYFQMLEDIEVAHLNTMIEIRKRTGQETTDLELQLAEKRIAAKEKENKRQHTISAEWKAASIDMAHSLSDAIFSINADRINRELDLQLSKLDKQREAELKNKKLTEEQKDAINEKYRKKAAALQLEAWKKQQRADIISSIIKTALAVVNALSAGDPVTAPMRAIAAGVAGAAQTTVIAAQKPPEFRKGGYTRSSSSDYHEAGIVHTNEFVANADAKRNPTIKPVLDIIDMAQKSGAVRTINLPAVLNVAQAASRTQTADNAQSLQIDASAMIQAMNEFKMLVEDLKTNGIHGKWVYQDLKQIIEKEDAAIKHTR